MKNVSRLIDIVSGKIPTPCRGCGKQIARTLLDAEALDSYYKIEAGDLPLCDECQEELRQNELYYLDREEYENDITYIPY